MRFGVQLVFYILVLPQHDPIRLAKQLATLDVLSGGRIDVGIGMGWIREEMEWLGKPFAGRAARAEEYLAAMRTLWTTDPATFEGATVAFALLARELARRGCDPADFPVMLRVPLYEPSPRATAHAVSSGATAMQYLQGDVERALRYVEEHSEEGTTHLWVSLPAEYSRIVEEMVAFAAELRRRGMLS